MSTWDEQIFTVDTNTDFLDELGDLDFEEIFGGAGGGGGGFSDFFEGLFGRRGRADLGFVEGLLAGFVQLGVDDLAHELTAEGLLDVGDRHLARTEALQLHLRGDFLDAGFELFVQLRDGNGDRDHAAEAFVRLFDDLHGRDSDALGRLAWRTAGAEWIKQEGRPLRSGASKPALMSRRSSKVNAAMVLHAPPP